MPHAVYRYPKENKSKIYQRLRKIVYLIVSYTSKATFYSWSVNHGYHDQTTLQL